MPEEIVTLWRYRDLPEALVAKSKLDSADVGCFLADENIVRLNWFWSNAVGGVRLQVLDTDSEDAMALLGEEIPASFSAEEIGEEYLQPLCPSCHSRDVSFQPFNKGIALILLSLIGLPILLGISLWFILFPVWIPSELWKCEDCGHDWKAEYD
jgi:hypothetical protein